jgi:hypothetical protein
MHRITWSSRLFWPFVAAVACVATLVGLAAGWLAGSIGDTQPQRPAPDAQVRVVKAPAEPAVERIPLCRTCEMGGPGRTL